MSLSYGSLQQLFKQVLSDPTELLQLTQGRRPVDFRKVMMAADARLTIPTELGLPLSLEFKAPVVVSVKGTVGLKFEQEAPWSIPQTFGLQSDLKVSVASRVLVEMNVRAGFVKTGAAMVTKMSAALPIEGALSVDLKTGKLSSTLELPQEPLELLNLEMMPITFTKVTPKDLAPHQPEPVPEQDRDRSGKVLQFARPPLANEEPNKYFSFQSKTVEDRFLSEEQQEQSTEFYRGLAIPTIESKEVPSENVLKMKTLNVVLGHPALGGLLEIKGQVQMPNGVPAGPLVPLGGKNRIFVNLKPSANGLKTVEVALYVRKTEAAGSSAPKWENLYDQLVGTRASDLQQQLQADLPAEFLSQDKSGLSVQLTVKGKTESSQELALQGVISLVRGMDGKFVKVAAEIQSPNERQPFQACLKGQTNYPTAYDVDEIMPGVNEPVTGQMRLIFGRSCQAPDATKISVKIVGDKSPKQLALEKNDYHTVEGSIIPVHLTKSGDALVPVMKPVYKQCEQDRKRGLKWSDACETVKELYSQLMQLKVDVDYSNVPLELEDALEKAERLVLANYYWNAEVNSARVSNQPGKVSLLADFTPADQMFDVVYSTPKKDVKLFNIPAPIAPLSADDEPLDMWEDLLQEDLEDVCSISGNHLKTLDSAEMKLPYSQCYHLLAKDCSPEERWSVLFASADTPNSSAKKVKVLIGNRKIELLPAEAVSSRLRSVSDVVVKVDGHQISLGSQNQEVQIDQDVTLSLRKTPGQESPVLVLSAEELGLELMFDGQNIALKPTFLLRNQICGLCGNNNEEQWDDMLLPSGKQAKTVEDLIRGFTVQQGDCASDLVGYEREQPQQEQQPEECKPKTLVKYLPQQICFSVEPVLTTSLDFEQERDEEFTKMQRVGFHCLPEDSTVGQRFEREAPLRVLSELAKKPVTDMFLVPAPQSCRSSLPLAPRRPEWF
jgi:hypothetical protein